MEFKNSPTDIYFAIPGVLIPENHMQSINDKFLVKAFRIIEKNLHDANFNAQKFSREIGISRAHLHRKLKALTNQSATEFTRSIRLKYAAEMLNKNTASVSEIAYLTGFNNLSYFTRCFKEEYGVVPSAYLTKNDIYKTVLIPRNF